MVFRGWRLFGIAGTIVVYVAGILLLSIISLQNSSQRRPRMRSLQDRDLVNLHRREMIMAKKSSTLTSLNWCRALTFTDGTPMKIETRPKKPSVQIFPGHLRRPKLTAAAAVYGNGTMKLDEVDRKIGKLRNNGNEIGNQIRYDPFYSRTRRKQEAERLKAVSKEKRLTTTTTTASPKKAAEERLTALASFPGSGNTWLRYLLQQATGFLTGSVYLDLGLSQSGFPAENIHNSSVLVVKTHEYGPQAFKMFSKALLLVRDPEKAILAEFNRQSAGHVGIASPERYTRTEGRYWHQFVVNKLWLWEHTNLSWAKEFPGSLKVVFYEDLVADELEATLRDILQFINGTMKIDEALMACAMARKEGIYRRRKRILQFDPFTKEMHEKIKTKRIEVYSKLGRNA